MLNEISNKKRKGEHTIAIFLDVQKAFDTVSHEILIEKLKYYGIQKLELKWFVSYLSDRPQMVEIDDPKSEYKTIRAGVPQGSILGLSSF